MGGCAMLGAVAVLLWTRLQRTREPLLFSTAPVARRSVSVRLAADGELQARTRVPVDSAVTAAVKEFYVQDGQWVRAGDLLVRLDRERSRQDFNRANQRLRMAQRELGAAEARWRKAEQAHWRVERLCLEQALAMDGFGNLAQDRDQAGLHRNRCRLAVKQAWLEVVRAREALDRTVIRAPVTGCVTGLRTEPGPVATQGSALLVLAQLEEMLAEVQLGACLAGRVKPGQGARVQVDALPGRTFPGQVLDVCLAPDEPRFWPRSPSQEAPGSCVRVLLQGGPEATSMRPGMRARVLLECQEEILAVPLRAIRQGPACLARSARSASPGGPRASAGRPLVYVVRDGLVEERPLRLGRILGPDVEVLEGLQPGEAILTGPARALATLGAGQRIQAFMGKTSDVSYQRPNLPI